MLALQLEACYYMQAIHGHTDLMNRRRPFDELLADASVPETLKTRLALVRDARQFAVDELGLPDNGSYRTYADLERDFVVWNVFATPEFSLAAKRWCYPVAGCVAYRGFFDHEDAVSFATKLERRGFDVMTGGVSAYSTLGRFDDPVLNTMMRWSDENLVQTMFHELAHQKLYVKGDTAFNESFASALAYHGLERWLESGGDTALLERIEARRELRRRTMALVDETKNALGAIYDSALSDADKRQQKKAILETLAARADALAAAQGEARNPWLDAPLNNASLVPMSLYEGHVDAFRRILDGCSQRLDCFYAEAERLAELSADERAAALVALSGGDARPVD